MLRALRKAEKATTVFPCCAMVAFLTPAECLAGCLVDGEKPFHLWLPFLLLKTDEKA